MTHITLHHRDIMTGDAALHMARTTLNNMRPKTLHTHDFFEVFWVQNGKVQHHTTDDSKTLTEGDLVFLRPGQLHALQGRGQDALVVSIAIHPGQISDMGQHKALQGHLFWSDVPQPIIIHRDIMQLAALNQSTLLLEQSVRDSLAATAFLLPLCATICAENAALPDGAPRWLHDTIIAARSPRVFRDGAAGLVRISGRAHPHVSRTMKRFTGQSPSEYVNTQRMAHAARALSGTNDTLAEIAADCGIPNLSHFHRLFRTHHRLTPNDYRLTHQRMITQPS